MAFEDIPERRGRLQGRILAVMIAEELRRIVGYDQSLERRQNTANFWTMMEQNQVAANRYSGSRTFYREISPKQGS